MLLLNYFFQGTLLIYLSESVMDDYEAGTVPPLPAPAPPRLLPSAHSPFSPFSLLPASCAGVVPASSRLLRIVCFALFTALCAASGPSTPRANR